MRTGQINVQTENIFPIIKKFLYSDHEIFLRELVSNAVDATQKLKFLSSNGEFKGELGDLRVDVILDPVEKTLTIRFSLLCIRLYLLFIYALKYKHSFIKNWIFDLTDLY